MNVGVLQLHFHLTRLSQLDVGNVVLLAYHIALGVPVCRHVFHKVKRYLLRFPEKHCVVRLRQQNATDY